MPKCRDGGSEAGGRGTDYRSTREHLPQLHLPSTLYHRHLPPPLDSSNSCCRLPKLGKLRDKGPVLLRGLSIKSSHRVNLSQFPKSSWPVNSNPHPYCPEKPPLLWLRAIKRWFPAFCFAIFSNFALYFGNGLPINDIYIYVYTQAAGIRGYMDNSMWCVCAEVRRKPLKLLGWALNPLLVLKESQGYIGPAWSGGWPWSIDLGGIGLNY